MNLIRKIFKKHRKRDYINTPYPKEEFRSVMNLTEIHLENKTDSEKMIMLDYIIDILKADICSSGIIEPFIVQPINAGRYFKKGKIISRCCDITALYPHCHTDGVYWFNSHTNDIIGDVDDFRLAAIYEIAKKRYFIRNNIN